MTAAMTYKPVKAVLRVLTLRASAKVSAKGANATVAVKDTAYQPPS